MKCYQCNEPMVIVEEWDTDRGTVIIWECYECMISEEDFIPNDTNDTWEEEPE